MPNPTPQAERGSSAFYKGIIGSMFLLLLLPLQLSFFLFTSKYPYTYQLLISRLYSSNSSKSHVL